jgi:hypothetical protein
MEIEAMSKHEGRAFLDRLVELRATYNNSDRTATAMTIEQAISHAIDLLNHPERLDAIMADGSTGDQSQLHPA